MNVVYILTLFVIRAFKNLVEHCITTLIIV